MSVNINRVMLAGNLTRDPEMRFTPSGTAVTNLGLAVNREYTTKEGEKKKEGFRKEPQKPKKRWGIKRFFRRKAF